MKTKVYSYMHAVNGLAVEIVSETEAEQDVLDAVWRHGRLETCYPSGRKAGNKSFIIRAFNKEAAAQAAERGE